MRVGYLKRVYENNTKQSKIKNNNSEMSFGTNQVKAAIISTYIVIKNSATVLYFSQTVTNRSILMQEGVRISSLLD